MPNFRILNINTSNDPQQWTSFINEVEQVDYELEPGEIRGGNEDDIERFGTKHDHHDSIAFLLLP